MIRFEVKKYGYKILFKLYDYYKFINNIFYLFIFVLIFEIWG